MSCYIRAVLRKALFIFAIILAVAVAFFFSHRREHPLPPGVSVDHIVVKKAAHTLSIFHDGKKIKTYRVALGRAPIGAKEQEGDMKTPEGSYTIDHHKSDSAFHRALHISYPSEQDIARASARGVSPGSDIMIHGMPNGAGAIGAAHRLKDWTAGCIALTNEEIEELYRVIPDGTVIEIDP
ncbi:MAG: hypothetical protein QOG48_720 [Verrucomicrobiota bacterium]